MKQKVQDASGSIPVLDIDMQAYAMMDGSKVYKQIMENLK